MSGSGAEATTVRLTPSAPGRRTAIRGASVPGDPARVDARRGDHAVLGRLDRRLAQRELAEADVDARRAVRRRRKPSGVAEVSCDPRKVAASARGGADGQCGEERSREWEGPDGHARSCARPPVGSLAASVTVVARPTAGAGRTRGSAGARSRRSSVETSSPRPHWPSRRSRSAAKPSARRFMTSATSSSACSTVWRGSSTNPVWIVSQRVWNSAFCSRGSSSGASSSASSLASRRESAVGRERGGARGARRRGARRSRSSLAVAARARRRCGRRRRAHGCSWGFPLPDLLGLRLRGWGVRGARRTARGSAASPRAGPRCSRCACVVDRVRLAVVLDDLGVVDGDVGRLLLEVLDGVAALAHHFGEQRVGVARARTPAGRRTATASRASARRSGRGRSRPAGGSRTCAGARGARAARSPPRAGRRALQRHGRTRGRSLRAAAPSAAGGRRAAPTTASSTTMTMINSQITSLLRSLWSSGGEPPERWG